MSEEKVKKSNPIAKIIKGTGGFLSKNAPKYWEMHKKIALGTEAQLVKFDGIVESPKLKLIRQSLLLNLGAALYVILRNGVGFLDLLILLFPQLLLFPAYVTSLNKEDADKK